VTNQTRQDKPAQIKGLLFDKDGTLFDFQTTWGPWAEIFIKHLAKDDAQLTKLIADSLGYDRQSGTFLKSSNFIAGTTEELLDVVLSSIPNMSRESLEAFYLHSTSQAELSPPVPLMPLLQQFKNNAIKIGVATNDHETTAINHLRKANIQSQFDFIAGFDSGYGAKPESGMQLAFCEATQLKPEQVAMVGDSLHDIESGNRAGMISIGVLTGMSTREELETKATVVLNDIGEITDWLDLS